MITTKALDEAFDNYMGNFRTRNAMVLHSDVQVGWALPAYITKSGQIFKSGVDEKGLFFITELRDDTKIAKRVADQVHDPVRMLLDCNDHIGLYGRAAWAIDYE